MNDSRQSMPEGQSRTEALRELSALADPARQSLYQAVSAADEPISRDSAASAAGISRTLAAYHLDLLVDAGLLGTTFARPEGAGGPGAGRPAKHYYRIQQERTVSVPPRDYELLADLLATAFDGDSDGSVRAALLQAASVEGRRFGSAGTRSAKAADPAEAGNTTGASNSPGTGNSTETDGSAETGGPAGVDDAGDPSAQNDPPSQNDTPAQGDPAPLGDPAAHGELCELLEQRGYEPAVEADGSIGLRNCPFHRLSRSHTDLVCGLNHALLSGVLEGRGDDSGRAELCPRDGRCCVVIHPETLPSADPGA